MIRYFYDVMAHRLEENEVNSIAQQDHGARCCFKEKGEEISDLLDEYKRIFDEILQNQ